MAIDAKLILYCKNKNAAMAIHHFHWLINLSLKNLFFENEDSVIKNFKF